MNRGVTLIEVLVAAFLGSILMGVVMLILSRTGSTFTKTSDMINAQVLLENIVEHLRSDARAMTSLVEETPDRITFKTVRGGREGAVTYRFLAGEQKITREYVPSAGGAGQQQDFQSQGRIMLAEFHPGLVERPGVTDAVDHIDLVLHIKTQEMANMPPTHISIICQAFSKCVQLPNPFQVNP